MAVLHQALDLGELILAETQNLGSAGNSDNSMLIFALKWKEPCGLETSLQNIPLAKNFVENENGKPPVGIQKSKQNLHFLKTFKHMFSPHL